MHRSVDTDDVGFARRESQHTPTTTADQERRTTGAERLRRSVKVGDAVMLACERALTLGKERAQHPGVFDHAIDAHLRRIHRDARALVVEPLPTRAETDLEPAFR